MNNEPHKSYDFGDELENVDIAEWTPSAPTNDAKPDPSPEAVRKVAEQAGFTSREPKAAPKKEPEDQITIRGKQSVIASFRAFASTQEPKWPLGYTLERALAALKNEMKG